MISVMVAMSASSSTSSVSSAAVTSGSRLTVPFMVSVMFPVSFMLFCFPQKFLWRCRLVGAGYLQVRDLANPSCFVSLQHPQGVRLILRANQCLDLFRADAVVRNRLGLVGGQVALLALRPRGHGIRVGMVFVRHGTQARHSLPASSPPARCPARRRSRSARAERNTPLPTWRHGCPLSRT